MVHPGRNTFRSALVFLFLSGSYLMAQQPDASLLQRYSQEGERALAENRYPDAEKAYEKLAKLQPGIAEVHANLGLVYFQEGKYAQAVLALRQALKIKPNLPSAGYFLAMSLSELGHYTEALPGLQKGFQNSHDSALKRLAGLHLERAYTGLRRDSEAVEVALELTRLYPEDPEVLYHAGRVSGNFAYLTMQKLSQVAPDSTWRHQAAGEVDESQEYYDRAIGEYRRVLALDPRRPGMHYRLGRVLLALSRKPNSPSEASGTLEALKEFEQELELDPTNANAAYEAGEIYRRMVQLDKAREFFEMALNHYPDFEDAQIGLGRGLIALGKPDLALPHLRKAISLNPENEVSYYQLSLAYRALGDVAEQQKALAEFQRLRTEKSRQQESEMKQAFSPREVTKQKLDSKDAP